MESNVHYFSENEKSITRPFAKIVLTRFGMAAFVFGLCIFFVVGTARILDKYDIVWRMCELFSPYARSVPWILVIIAFTLVLCIPGRPTAIRDFLHRVNKFGPFELLPSESPETTWLKTLSFQFDLKECPQVAQPHTDSANDNDDEVVSDSKRLSGGMRTAFLKTIPPEKYGMALKVLSEIKQRKRWILQQYSGRLEAPITDRDVRKRQFPVHFDACLTHGDEKMLVRVADLTSRTIGDVVSQFNDFAESHVSATSQKVSYHLLVAVPAKADKREETMQSIRQSFPAGKRFQLHFYSVAEDNSIKPLEKTP